MKSVLPIFIITLLLWSCSNPPKPATFDIVELEQAFEADINLNYNKAIGDSDLSYTINKNVSKTIIEMVGLEQNSSNINEVVSNFNAEYVTFTKEFPEAKEPKWELSIESEVTYQSESVITMAITVYSFKGGAHGNDSISLLNLDAKTGELLTFQDIINNESDFKALVKTHFIETLKAENDTTNIEDLFFGKPFQLPENIGFSDDGLIVLYSAYEVASYNQNYIEFAIPFEALNDYLKLN